MAIWVRVLKPSLSMMFAIWRATVAGLMNSSPAIALLLRPLTTKAAIRVQGSLLP